VHFNTMTELIEDEFNNIRSIRETKGLEYAGEQDTLADFKEVAEDAGITPLQVWLTYVKKHQRAVDTFIREGEVKSESIESRIRDIIVYHLLLYGLIIDLQGEKEAQDRQRELAAQAAEFDDPPHITVEPTT
jgi:hypothetical protein